MKNRLKKAVRSTSLMLLMCLLCFMYIYSQEPSSRIITGKVTFAEDNQPVPGANIIIKGTTTGTVANANGEFSISAKPGDILVISFLGYNSAEITVGNQTNIDVLLTEEYTKLDEVVVIGYGQMKRSDLTGSVVSVSSDEISKTEIEKAYF